MLFYTRLTDSTLRTKTLSRKNDWPSRAQSKSILITTQPNCTVEKISSMQNALSKSVLIKSKFLTMHQSRRKLLLHMRLLFWRALLKSLCISPPSSSALSSQLCIIAMNLSPSSSSDFLFLLLVFFSGRRYLQNVVAFSISISISTFLFFLPCIYIWHLFLRQPHLPSFSSRRWKPFFQVSLYLTLPRFISRLCAALFIVSTSSYQMQWFTTLWYLWPPLFFSLSFKKPKYRLELHKEVQSTFFLMNFSMNRNYTSGTLSCFFQR